MGTAVAGNGMSGHHCTADARSTHGEVQLVGCLIVQWPTVRAEEYVGRPLGRAGNQGAGCSVAVGEPGAESPPGWIG